MLYRIRYADGRVLDVEGDHVVLEGETHIVIRQVQVVVGRPREVVVRRVRAEEIIDVAEAPC